MQIELLSRPYTREEGEVNDMREGGVALLTMIVMLATIITFGRWIVLSHRNLPALGARHIDFTPGWAVGWFFIPIANWFKPYQAMRSLWQHSRNVHKPEIEDSTWVLPTWWTLWLISSFLGNIAMRVTLRADTNDELLVSSRLDVANCAVDIALYAVAAVLVTRIWQSQKTQRDNPAAALPSGFADIPQTLSTSP